MDGERGERALVHGQGQPQQFQGQAAQAVDHGGMDDGRHGVEVAAHGRGGTGKIDQHGLAADLDGDLDGHGGGGLAVVVQGVAEGVLPGRDAGDGGASEPLRVVNQLVGVAEDGGQAVALHDAGQPPGTGVVGGELGGQVAVALGRGAYVAQNELPEGFVALPGG